MTNAKATAVVTMMRALVVIHLGAEVAGVVVVVAASGVMTTTVVLTGKRIATDQGGSTMTMVTEAVVEAATVTVSAVGMAVRVVIVQQYHRDQVIMLLLCPLSRHHLIKIPHFP